MLDSILLQDGAGYVPDFMGISGIQIVTVTEVTAESWARRFIPSASSTWSRVSGCVAASGFALLIGYAHHDQFPGVKDKKNRIKQL